MRRWGNGRKNRVHMLGERFGRWTVVEEPDGAWCYVVCDCGHSREVRRSNLLSGQSTSCGCLLRDIWQERARRRHAAA
jgi:hypothetical protein